MTRLAVSFLTYLHWLLVAYSLFGWIWPAGDTWRLIYAVYVPLIMLQWWFNKGVCVINNLENLLAVGRWRDHRRHGAQPYPTQDAHSWHHLGRQSLPEVGAVQRDAAELMTDTAEHTEATGFLPRLGRWARRCRAA